MELFDYLNEINVGKKDVMSSEAYPYDFAENEKKYNPYLINMMLAWNKELVPIVNEMNRLHHLPKKMQYHFYLHMIPKKKRYAKKVIIEDESEYVELLCEKYNVNKTVARQYERLMSAEDLEKIKASLDKGGLRKNKRK